MAYESVFEKFEAIERDGTRHAVAFKKAGTLASGDQPELYFFEVDARPIIVCIGGAALTDFQRANRYLSREEKIDVAGMFLTVKIASGADLAPENLRIERAEIELLVRELGIFK